MTCSGCYEPDEPPGVFIMTDEPSELNRWWNCAFVQVNGAITVCEDYLKSGVVASDAKNLAVAARNRLENLIKWLEKREISSH